MAKTKHIKVRDLKPSKDAKGGGATRNSSGLNSHGANSSGLNSSGTNSHGMNSHGANTKHQNLGGGHGHG